MGYVPPRAKLLAELALAGRYPAPLKAQIHVGADDWQSHPDAVSQFARATGIPCTVVPGRGHTLGQDYVGRVLDAWVGSPA